MAEIRDSNLFTTVVHDAPHIGTQASNLFTTVVHDAPRLGTQASNLFSTVVHTVSSSVFATNLVVSVVHDATGSYLPFPLQGDRVRYWASLQGGRLTNPKGGNKT